MEKIVVITFIAAFSALFFWAAFSLSGDFYVFVRRMFGAKAVYIRRTERVNYTDVWIAIAEVDAWGTLHAFRYPGSKIGRVTLNPDGTGEYCGPVEWKYV